MYYFWMYLGQGTKGHEIKTGFLFHCPIHHIRKKKKDPEDEMLCPEEKIAQQVGAFCFCTS